MTAALRVGLLCGLLGAGACGGGELQVRDAVVHRTPGSAVAVVYLVVDNPGPEDRLLGARSDAADRTELHETVEEGDVMRMLARPEGLPVPMGVGLRLQAGGPHLMLMGLTRALEVGDEIGLVLEFERAGERRVRAKVEPRG